MYILWSESLSNFSATVYLPRIQDHELWLAGRLFCVVIWIHKVVDSWKKLQFLKASFTKVVSGGLCIAFSPTKRFMILKLLYFTILYFT